MISLHPGYGHFSICATCATSGTRSRKQEGHMWIAGNNCKHICVVIYFKPLLFQVINCR